MGKRKKFAAEEIKPITICSKEAHKLTEKFRIAASKHKKKLSIEDNN